MLIFKQEELKKKGKHIYYNIIKVITNNPTKENLWSFLLLIVYWNVFALSLSLFLIEAHLQQNNVKYALNIYKTWGRKIYLGAYKIGIKDNVNVIGPFYTTWIVFLPLNTF